MFLHAVRELLSSDQALDVYRTFLTDRTGLSPDHFAGTQVADLYTGSLVLLFDAHPGKTYRVSFDNSRYGRVYDVDPHSLAAIATYYTLRWFIANDALCKHALRRALNGMHRYLCRCIPLNRSSSPLQAESARAISVAMSTIDARFAVGRICR